MLNLLYCFDENYNKQTFISIYSILRLLDKNQKIAVYAVHKNPDTFLEYSNKLKEYKNIENINIYKFEDELIFPKLDKSHVSEATYYRLMIENYIPVEIENLIYLDSDVIALNNPYKICMETLGELKKSNFTIGVSTEIYNDNKNIHFKNIDLKSLKYFNAGVMFIDYKKWRERELKSKFIKKVEEYKEVIKLWDQDILNNHFSGNFYEISSLLNFRVNTNNNLSFLENNVIFYHFSGDHKPWLLKGSLDDTAKIFFDIYSEIDEERYFFTRKTGKTQYIKALLNLIFKRRFWSLNNKFKFIKQAVKEIRS